MLRHFSSANRFELGGNTNFRGSSADAVDLIPILKAEAEGWYDTTDASTLKTDLVASFDSASAQYLTIPQIEQTGLDPANMTMACWVNITTGGLNGIMGKYQFTATRHFALYLDASNILRGRASSDGTISTQTEVTYNTSIVGGLAFVALVYDGTNLKLYVDGVERDSGALASLYQGSDYPFYVGKISDIDELDGEISNAAVWSTGLSASEITALYNSGVPRTYEDLTTAEKVSLVSFWRLNEKSEARYDAHGTNHLTSINTVGSAHGTVEHAAGTYGGHTKITNLGTAASPFGDLTAAAATCPVPNAGGSLWGGGDFLSCVTPAFTGTMVVATDNGAFSAQVALSAAINDLTPFGFGTFQNNDAHTVYGMAFIGRVLTSVEVAAILGDFDGDDSFTGVTDLGSKMFRVKSLTTIPTPLDMSSATTIQAFLQECSGIVDPVDLSPWGNHQGTSLNNSFRGWSQVTSLPLDQVDFSNVTSCTYLCRDCTSLTTIPLFTAGPSVAWLGAFENCALTADSVNNILISIEAEGTSGGTLDIDLGTNAAPTGAGATAKTTLQGRGWTVTTN